MAMHDPQQALGHHLLEPVEDVAELASDTYDAVDVAERILSGDHLALRGVPGSGRTSWLASLASFIRHSESAPVVVQLDASDRSLYDEAAVVRRIWAAVRPKSEPQETADPVRFEDLSQDIAAVGRVVVILVDNYEGLVRRAGVDRAEALAMFAPLRAMATSRSDARLLRLVLAGTSSIAQFGSTTGSNVFSFIADPVVLGPLGETRFASFWASLFVNESMPVDLTAAQAFLLTGGWPALTKRLLASLYESSEHHDSASFGTAIRSLDGFFQRQWVRLDSKRQAILVEAARGALTSVVDRSDHAVVNDLVTLGLLEKDLQVRGTRWLRYVERQATGGYKPFLAVGGSSPRLVHVKERITARVKRWVDGEVWLVNQLPQMVEHSASHGTNVDRNAMMLMQIRDRARSYEAPPEVYEVLSGAAWLHDIGHAGGHLNHRVVTDFRHVRKFHGLFSEQMILDSRNAFFPDQWDAYTNESAIAAAVALLSAFHQRHGRLDSREYWRRGTAPKSVSACEAPVCSSCDAAVQAYVPTFLERMHQEQLVGFFAEDDLLDAVAILRVADAMDIGSHRVSKRITLGQLGADRFWYAKAASDLGDVLQPILRWAEVICFNGLVNGLKELLVVVERAIRSSDYRSCAALSQRGLSLLATLRIDVVAEGAEVEALTQAGLALEDFRNFVNFLDVQDTFRRLHLAFGGADAYDNEDGTFDVVLKSHPGGLATDSCDRFEEAAEYIWSEYLGVEQIMIRGRLRLHQVRGDRDGIGPVRHP